jgi:hypothetical protein
LNNLSQANIPEQPKTWKPQPKERDLLSFNSRGKNLKTKKNHQFHSYESDLETKTGEHKQQQTFNNLVRSLLSSPAAMRNNEPENPEGTMSCKVRW